MIGETIGNFRLVKRLGKGGMGEVFLAEHKDLQTPAAVKLLNEEISENKEHVQRFFNEARIVSKIKHAGRVQIFDSGYHNGKAYLVMELLDGESLAKRLERVGGVALPELFDIGQQIASVLDATHRAGVTHRDLKPDNIFIVHDDERASGERVKILDFGIAKLTGGSTLASNSPKTSGTMGTPTYMAPEQWGDSSLVDWRADAYSLGCVMFEVATGRPPFQCTSIPEAYTKHLTAKPPAVRSLRPDSPAELDALIARLLAKEPAERCKSLGEVSATFAAMAGRRPSAPVAAVATMSEDKPRFAPAPTMTTLSGSAAEVATTRSHKRAAVGGGIAAGVLVIGFVVFAVTRGGGGEEAGPTTSPQPAPATGTATATPPAPVTAPAPAPAPAPVTAPAPASASAPAAATGSATAAAAATAPAAAAAPAAAIPQPQPVPSPQPPPTPMTIKPTAHADHHHTDKPHVAKTTTPTPTTTPVTKPATGSGSGSAKPPTSDDDKWGGRL